MTAKVIGMTRENAAIPTALTRTKRICSVAYADEEMTSEDRTARAVGRPRRSVDWRSVAIGGPRRRFFSL